MKHLQDLAVALTLTMMPTLVLADGTIGMTVPADMDPEAVKFLFPARP